MRKHLKLFLIMTSFVGLLAACGRQDEETITEATKEKTTTEESATTTEASKSFNEETGTYPNGSHPKFSGKKLRLTIGNQEAIIAMYDNSAADAFIKRLPLKDLSFSDLSGIEKPVEAPDTPFSLGDEKPGYDPVTGEMVIYRPWGNFTIFYGDFRHSDELVPLGKVESGLDVISEQTEDFTGTLELVK